MKKMKQTKKVLKKKVVKSKVEELEDDDAWESEVEGSEEPILKPLRLRLVLDNGYDVVFGDIDSGYLYSLEKHWNRFSKGNEYSLRLLGIQG